MVKDGEKAAIGLGIIGLGIGAALTAVAAYFLTKGKEEKPPVPPPPGGPVSFTIKIINLPSETNMWGCAFQDPTTGEYYQPTNRPIMGSHLFGSSESAELSSPVSSGILSISAFSQASIMEVIQIVNYQINMSVTDNGVYVFDFSTGKII